MSGQVFAKVLVGWDASTGAASALRLGLRLTAHEGGELTALAVVPGYPHVEDSDERKAAEAGARAAVQEPYEAVLAEHQVAAGQASRLQIVEADDVARVLEEYATRHRYDLVVVGLHGREGMLHPRMGHIASHAVRRCQCPVLVVPEAGGPPPVTGPSPSLAANLFHPFRRHQDWDDPAGGP